MHRLGWRRVLNGEPRSSSGTTKFHNKPSTATVVAASVNARRGERAERVKAAPAANEVNAALMRPALEMELVAAARKIAAWAYEPN
jgi:hypothetical protein